MDAGKPLLLGTGVLSEEEFEVLRTNALREIDDDLDPDATPQYARLQCVYATRKAGVELGSLI